MRTGWALGQFPVVAEEVGEEIVAPLGWRLGPNDFQAAADGVSTKTLTKFILPSEALVLDVGAFWFGADVVGGNRGTVSFAEGVTAGNQRDCFFVVHGHTVEGFANVSGCCYGIGLAIWPFRVHVNQAHLNRAERI